MVNFSGPCAGEDWDVDIHGNGFGMEIGWLNAPSYFTASAVTKTSITWAWVDTNTDPDEDYYILIDPDTDEVIEDNINDTAFTETGLAPNTIYSRAIVACKDNE